MYYQNYEDYMRSILGYPTSSPNIYENYDYRASFNMNNMAGYSPTYQDVNQNKISNLSENDIRSLYPDIYHLITPMIDKVCKTNREAITRELIEKMTDEIYMAMEEKPDIVVNIRAEAKKMPEDIESNKRKTETRQRNFMLRDLIKILLLNQLFGDGRPPRLRPLRPPFPGGPGMPPMPRDYSNYLQF